MIEDFKTVSVSGNRVSEVSEKLDSRVRKWLKKGYDIHGPVQTCPKGDYNIVMTQALLKYE